jgi:hypothetical protein
MNWKRRLLRLWPLAAVLWIVGAGSIAVLHSSPVQRRLQAPDDDLCAATRRSAKEFLEQSEGDSRAAGHPGSPRFGACDDRIDYVRDWRLPAWPMVVIIIAVPGLLFGLVGTTPSVVAAKSDHAGGPTHSFSLERAASFLSPEASGSHTAFVWRRRVTLAIFALLCVGIGVGGTVIVYAIRNSYENCILRSMPGAPERAVALIRDSCRNIAW